MTSLVRLFGGLAALSLLIGIMTLQEVPAASGQTEPTPTSTPAPEKGQEQSDPREGHEHETQRDGLGSYGPSGPIERGDLDPGLSLAVSDDALDAAQGGELATARATWRDAPFDFVDQVDYQLEFRRQNDYMGRDLSHIAAVLELRPENIGIQGLGLYLSDDEATEFERRLQLGDKIPEVVGLAGGVSVDSLAEGQEPRHGSNFGGVWQDQFDGGAIVVAVTDANLIDRDEIARLLGGREHLRIIDAHPSWDQVNAWRDELLANGSRAGLSVSVSIESTTKGRRLTLATENPAAAQDSVLGSVPQHWVTIVQGTAEIDAGNPTQTHSASSQMAGLQIEFDPGRNCTWGISGNNGIDHYIITAGHCGGSTFANFTGWTDTLEVHQNNSFHLTSGWRYVISHEDYNRDVKGVSTGYADDNCYHWGHCQKHIASRAWNNSWEINSDVTCASLSKSNVFRCGYILEENWTGSGGCVGNQWLRVGMAVIPGDSGAGGIDQSPTATTFDAVLACQKGASESIWMTAYRVKAHSGLDANCHATVVSYYSPSSWGTCPGVNR